MASNGLAFFLLSSLLALTQGGGREISSGGLSAVVSQTAPGHVQRRAALLKRLMARGDTRLKPV